MTSLVPQDHTTLFQHKTPQAHTQEKRSTTASKGALDPDGQQHGDASFCPKLGRMLARLELRGDDKGRPFSRAGAKRVHVGRANVHALGCLFLCFHRLKKSSIGLICRM